MLSMGAQQEGVHLCGLSASGTSGEHLGSHQMVQLPAAVSGNSPRLPRAAELRLSTTLLALAGLTPQLVPNAPSPNVGTVLASPHPKCSQPYEGTAPRAEFCRGPSSRFARWHPQVSNLISVYGPQQCKAKQAPKASGFRVIPRAQRWAPSPAISHQVSAGARRKGTAGPGALGASQLPGFGQRTLENLFAKVPSEGRRPLEDPAVHGDDDWDVGGRVPEYQRVCFSGQPTSVPTGLLAPPGCRVGSAPGRARLGSNDKHRPDPGTATGRTLVLPRTSAHREGLSALPGRRAGDAHSCSSWTLHQKPPFVLFFFKWCHFPHSGAVAVGQQRARR